MAEPTSKRLLNYRALLAQLPQALRWVWQANARASLALCGVTLVMGLLPAAMAWVGRRIIDGVVLAASSGAEADRVAALEAMALEFGLALVLLGSRRLQGTLRNLLRAAVGNLLNGRLLEKALTLDLAQFEDSKTYDLLQSAQRDAGTRPISLALATLLLVRSLITLASLSWLLWGLAWWSVIPLALSAIPEFFIETKLSGEAFSLSMGRAEDSRRLTYLEWVLTRDSHAKEVKLYDLGPLLLGRHRALFERFFREDQKLARRQLLLGTFFAGLSSLSFYVCYAAVGYRAAMGLLSVGDLTLSIAAFRQGQGALEDVLSSLAGMYDDALYVSNLTAFYALPTPATSSVPQLPARVLPPGRFSIELDRVSFRYPGRVGWAIRELSLTIKPGEKLALVGENGAGKSTLIKLLLRLYEPTEGTIRFGGIDVRELDVKALRARLGAVFQDFVRYQLTAAENIGLGDVSRLDDGALIDQAARDGGAQEVVDELPGKRETMLGTWFEGAHELSGGQWQKLAIARSFMRLTSREGDGADLLVLDEPTAAIDAEAEVALFERFQKLTVGRSAIIISHRFSTVRMADHIAVLEHGRLLELGSHEELLALKGRYAHLFALQARGYR
jgi:ATP-binding cassette subfamily B protein/ATP-binding cassette subfamily C protein